MKTKLILITLLVLFFSNIENKCFSQDSFYPSRVSLELGPSFGLTNNSNGSFDFALTCITKKWGNKFLQTGLGLSFNGVVLNDVPINNENTDVNLPTKFIKFQNKLVLSLSKKNDVFIFGELTYGIGLETNNRVTYSQKEGHLFEQGIGLQFYTNRFNNNFQYIKVGLYHTSINTKGKLIANNSRVKINTQNYMINARVTVDLLSVGKALLFVCKSALGID